MEKIITCKEESCSAKFRIDFAKMPNKKDIIVACPKCSKKYKFLNPLFKEDVKSSEVIEKTTERNVQNIKTVTCPKCKKGLKVDFSKLTSYPAIIKCNSCETKLRFENPPQDKNTSSSATKDFVNASAPIAVDKSKINPKNHWSYTLYSSTKRIPYLKKATLLLFCSYLIKSVVDSVKLNKSESLDKIGVAKLKAHFTALSGQLYNHTITPILAEQGIPVRTLSPISGWAVKKIANLLLNKYLKSSGLSQSNPEFKNIVKEPFFKSTLIKFGLSILLAIISIILFYFKDKYLPTFPYIELLLMVYPLVFLKKEKFNSLFNCALILPAFYLLNFIVFLVLIKNGDAYYYLAFKSYLYIYFLLYITMIVALGLYEKFKDTDNKFVILASQINFDKKAYVWITSGFFAIAAFSFPDLSLVSFLLLIFPTFIAFKETNKNLFRMVLLLPIAYLVRFVIEQIDWSSIFDQSTFVSESYSDAMYYAKPVYVLLLIASVIYYGYRKIEESNMPIFVKKMKLLVKFNWVIGCFSFIIPIAIIILSSGVLSESKTNSVNIPADTIVVNVPTTQQTQPVAAEKEQSQPVTNVSARQTIDLYYEDLHSENFEANRYFASEVERFISMKNTTPEAINKYVVNSYFKGYKNNDFSVEDGSYEERNLDNGDTEASFIEVGTCYKVKQDKDLFTRLKMVVLVNSEGKIYKWTQTAVLEKR